jgi:hypothetical protein
MILSYLSLSEQKKLEQGKLYGKTNFVIYVVMDLITLRMYVFKIITKL